MRLPFVRRKKYDELVYKLECLLCHATGGKLSKHTYSLNTMTSEVTDYLNSRCDECYFVKRLAPSVLAEVEECMRAFEDDDDGYILKKCEFEFFMREIKNEYLKGESNT